MRPERRLSGRNGGAAPAAPNFVRPTDIISLFAPTKFAVD